jgi:hypothetical protein
MPASGGTTLLRFWPSQPAGFFAQARKSACLLFQALLDGRRRLTDHALPASSVNSPAAVVFHGLPPASTLLAAQVAASTAALSGAAEIPRSAPGSKAGFGDMIPGDDDDLVPLESTRVAGWSI